MTSNPDEPIWGELGIEFVVQLLLFLYPYGAAQMRVPYNFWVGVGCRVFATAIAIRMFWIFPPWAQKLTRLKKALISLVAVGIFIVAFSSPATNAYYKVNQTHGIEVVVPPSTQLVTDSPAVAQYLKPVRPTSLVPALPLPTPTAPNDILIGSITQGSNSITQVGNDNATIEGLYDTKTFYSYNGVQKKEISEGGTHIEVTGRGDADFKQMVDRAENGDWAGLIALCKMLRETEPTWATTYIFESLANLRLGRLDQADTQLNRAQAITGNDPEYKSRIDKLRAVIHQQRTHASRNASNF